MRTKTGPNGSADRHVKEIKRKTRRKFSAEEKIRIVLDGLRGESSISELCRREGIAESLYYSWSKEFLEAGKRRLSGDTVLTTITTLTSCISTRQTPGNHGMLNYPHEYSTWKDP